MGHAVEPRWGYALIGHPVSSSQPSDPRTGAGFPSGFEIINSVQTGLYAPETGASFAVMIGRTGRTHKSDRSVIYIAIALGVAILAAGAVVDVMRSSSSGTDFTAPFFVDEQSVVADAHGPAAITSQPIATWVTSSAGGLGEVVERAVGSIPVVVTYNIPGRDCGSHSASDAVLGPESYREWVRSVVDALGSTRAVVIVEPDALALIDCLSSNDRSQRLDLLAYAVRQISAQGSWVYLDAGHSGWHPASEMAALLHKAGIADATGFSLNVSNFRSTADETAYGIEISNALGTPTPFVIDTSRNGVQPANGEWCNPPGMRLGVTPTMNTGSDLVDAWLWIKTPGLSDGPCNGGPEAGDWWEEYARELVSG